MGSTLLNPYPCPLKKRFPAKAGISSLKKTIDGDLFDENLSFCYIIRGPHLKMGINNNNTVYRVNFVEPISLSSKKAIPSESWDLHIKNQLMAICSMRI